MIHGFILHKVKQIFLFFRVSRLAPGPGQPPIQWVAEVLSLRLKWWGTKLSSHSHLVLFQKKNSYTSTATAQLKYGLHSADTCARTVS